MEKNRLGVNATALYEALVKTGSRKLLTAEDFSELLNRKVAKAGVSNTLSVLARIGAVEKIRRGLYLNKSTGTTPRIVDLIPDVMRNSTYYLGLNAAANFWGLTVQIPSAYHILYSGASEAEQKRVTRWSRALSKQSDLGGVLVPVKMRTSHSPIGTSQVIMEGTQLRMSTRELTLIDAAIYTEETGGAGQALAWMKNALALHVGFSIKEFAFLLEMTQKSFHSIGARVGFLLEMVLAQSRYDTSTKTNIESLLRRLERAVTREDASYSWGPRKSKHGEYTLSSKNVEYFRRWHLHVSGKYLRELQV